jgi:hypothetical protein
MMVHRGRARFTNIYHEHFVQTKYDHFWRSSKICTVTLMLYVEDILNLIGYNCILKYKKNYEEIT